MNKGFSAGALVSLAWLATGANAFGQAQTWKPSPNEPLEKYDMPPAYIYRLDTSPRMISPHGVFTSYQVNVDAAGNNVRRTNTTYGRALRQSDANSNSRDNAHCYCYRYAYGNSNSNDYSYTDCYS